MTMLEKYRAVQNTTMTEIPPWVRWITFITQQVVLFFFFFYFWNSFILLFLAYVVTSGLSYWFACEIHWKIQRSKQEQSKQDEVHSKSDKR